MSDAGKECGVYNAEAPLSVHSGLLLSPLPAFHFPLSMPKHALSFKHLIGSATEQRKEEKKERSVAELLSLSRQSQVREPAPHVSPQVIQHGPDGASIHPYVC